jgi:hypothetical protein
VRRRIIGLLVAGLTAAAALAALPAGASSPAPSAVVAADLVPPVVLPPPVGPRPRPSPKPSPAKPPPTAAPQDRWALIVGVTDYRGNVKDTRGGANDARLVRQTLLHHGWRSDRIRVLTDGQATGRAVSQGLSWLQANSSSKTFSFFHYSGHVKQRNGHEYLWPVDNAYIADTEMSRVLKAVRGAAWTNISGCEGGGFDEGLSSPRHLFTASSHVTEKSYEDPRTGYSVWSGMLYRETLLRKDADRDGDGHVTVEQAFDHAAPRARAYTRNQRPHGPQTPQRAGGSGALRLDAPPI